MYSSTVYDHYIFLFGAKENYNEIYPIYWIDVENFQIGEKSMKAGEI